MSIFLWLKAFHIIFIVTWFAGLFYLPRLFVYHAQIGSRTFNNNSNNNSSNNLENIEHIEHQKSYERFCTMEKKLFWVIMTPSAVLTLIMGSSLIMIAGPASYRHAGWLHLKLILVLFLLFYHHLCAKYLKHFQNNTNTRSETFFRYFNEIPSVILIVVVILAVVKPF